MGDSSTWRTELLARLPWIEYLPESRTCNQYRWSSMSLKAAYDLELREKYRCRKPAKWRFVGLLASADDAGYESLYVGKSGVYCYSHLIRQAFIPTREEERYNTWCQKNASLVQRIKDGVEPRVIERKIRRAPHDISNEA